MLAHLFKNYSSSPKTQFTHRPSSFLGTCPSKAQMDTLSPSAQDAGGGTVAAALQVQPPTLGTAGAPAGAEPSPSPQPHPPGPSYAGRGLAAANFPVRSSSALFPRS